MAWSVLSLAHRGWGGNGNPGRKASRDIGEGLPWYRFRAAYSNGIVQYPSDGLNGITYPPNAPNRQSRTGNPSNQGSNKPACTFASAARVGRNGYCRKADGQALYEAVHLPVQHPPHNLWRRYHRPKDDRMYDSRWNGRQRPVAATIRDVWRHYPPDKKT